MFYIGSYLTSNANEGISKNNAFNPGDYTNPNNLETIMSAMASSPTTTQVETSTTLLQVNSTPLGSYDYRISDETTISSFNVNDYFSNNQDRIALIAFKNNITINTGQTFTPGYSRQKLFTCIYVNGNLTLNGNISMSKCGGNWSGNDPGVDIPLTSNSSSVVLANGCGDGGLAYYYPGSGAYAQLQPTSAASLGGTFSGAGGNAGGGVGGNPQTNWQPIGNFGGPGGFNVGGSGYTFGGGAGNPGKTSSGNGGNGYSSENGVGGTIILFVTGQIIGSGNITAIGSKGGDCVMGTGSRAFAGGGSGGGGIYIICPNGQGGVSTSASGGAAGQFAGGNSGDGYFPRDGQPGVSGTIQVYTS